MPAPSYPQCGSTHVAAGTKGFRLGNAAKGAFWLGPVGLLGGVVGSKDVLLSCMTCGAQWEPSIVRPPRPALLSWKGWLLIIMGVPLAFGLVGAIATALRPAEAPVPVVTAVAPRAIPVVDVSTLPTEKSVKRSLSPKPATSSSATRSLEDWMRESVEAGAAGT
jgi:hypothetical protein